jgi:hypothetical protein
MKLGFMRFGRIILASLTALVACSFTHGGPSSTGEVTRTDSLPRLLHTVVPLFVSAVESVSPAPVARSSAHAVLTLEALAETPLSGALYLVASLFAVNVVLRRHQRALLRC